MHIIPNFAELRPSSIRTILTHTLLCRIISRPTAPNIRHGTRFLGQLALDVRQSVRRTIAGCNIDLLQPAKCGESLVIFDCSLEELDHFLVLDVIGSVAGNVECRVAGRVLGELVGPEVYWMLVQSLMSLHVSYQCWGRLG